MAIRTITWTVDDDMQVTPRGMQNAGVQGDDKATRIQFALPAFLQEGYTLYIECVDSVGEGDKTDPLAVIDGAVSFDLPLAWTQHGGEATLRLVAEVEVEGVVAYTAIGRVRYDGRATAFAKMKSLVDGSIQALLERITKMIADAKVWIDNVNGVYVGSGDMPDGCVIQIDPTGEALLLDNELTDDSENVPKTKVVKEYVDNVAKECVLYPGCFYRSSRYGGMEWINPPMLPGVEYLTTERHNGEPVWVKLVDLGTYPTVEKDESGNPIAIAKTIPVINYGKIYWFDIWTTRNEEGIIQHLPFFTNSGKYCNKAHVTLNQRIQLNCVESVSEEYTIRAIVKFTRPEIKPAATEWEQRMLERIDLAMLHTVALRNVPKSSKGVTAAGEVLTGINYSSVYVPNSKSKFVRENSRLVGTEPGTSLSTYYSALENPASIMYTSGDVDLESDERSSYYGIDCSGFACYALGLGKWIWTKAFAGHETCGNENIFEKYCTVIIRENEETPDLSKIKRGDLIINTLDAARLDNGNHVKLVKDVLHDKDGNLLGFNIAESVRPYVRVVYMTPSEFLAQIAYDEKGNPQPYGVIRYDASKFSLDVEKVEYSKFIYPNMGDGGKYTVGDIVELYIPESSATAIIVNGDVKALSDLETAHVNEVMVYKLQLDEPGTYTIATDTAPHDPCTVIVKEAK